MRKCKNAPQIFVLYSLIIGDDIELVALSTPEMMESVFINIETDLLLLPVTEKRALRVLTNEKRVLRVLTKESIT